MAQDLTGHVTSKADDKPIAYATVTLKENRLYAFTDEKGNYTIKKRTQRKVYGSIFLHGLRESDRGCHGQCWWCNAECAPC